MTPIVQMNADLICANQLHLRHLRSILFADL